MSSSFAPFAILNWNRRAETCSYSARPSLSMTRRRITKIKPRNCRNIASYLSQTAMKTPAVLPTGPPPAKKTKLDLSPLLPPPTAVIPPSLLSPSLSPPLPSSSKPTPTNFHSLNTPKTTTCTLTSKTTSPLLPPTPTSAPSSSLSDDLEQLLMLRGIDFDRKHISPDQVRVFSRNQTSISDSLINHIQYMGMRKDRLCRLMDYLLVQLSHSRMPPGDIMTRLWNMTSDIEVVSKSLDCDVVLKVTCFYHSILSLHPPGLSDTAHQQYCQFIQGLGGGKESGIFAAWSHVKELLSSPGYKYFHHHITFLVDLLLSDLWSHLTGSQTGQPLFVSIFWSRPSTTDTLSLPVRQLLDIIHNMLEDYSGTEVELFVLQSQFALLFLIMTRCKDAVMVELVQLATKLTKDQHVLLLSLLHPQSVHVTLIQDFIHHFLPSTATKGAAKTRLLSPNSKLASFNQLSIATTHHSLLQSSTTTLPPTILHKAQDNVKPLSCVRSTTKRHISWCPIIVEAKKVKVSGRTCENCDNGILTCHRCNSHK